MDSHFHLRAIALRGLLEYAVVTGDDRIKEFVRRSYEYMRMYAIPRMGFISCMPASRLARYCESCMLGDWVALRLLHRNLRPLNAATLGLLLMGAIKFLPFVGVWVWTAATLIGIGATLATKFGRREAWFDLASAP